MTQILKNIKSQISSNQSLLKDRIETVTDYFSYRSISQQRLFSRLVWMALKGLPLYASQEYYGDSADVSRRQANRIIKDLYENGLIHKRYRGVKRTCKLKINSLILHPKVLLELTDLFPFLHDQVRYGLLVNNSSRSYFVSQVFKDNNIRSEERSSLYKMSEFFDNCMPIQGEDKVVGLEIELEELEQVIENALKVSYPVDESDIKDFHKGEDRLSFS